MSGECDMRDELEALVHQPTAKNYRQLRERLLSAGDPLAHLAQLDELTRLISFERWPAAARALDKMWVAGLLSPRMHYWAACVAEQRGDEEDADLERGLFQTVLAALLATGRGTPEAPFLITYLSDVHDLLMHLQLRPLDRRLVEHDGRWCDVVRCRGGRELWCDVADLVARSARNAEEFALEFPPLPAPHLGDLALAGQKR
jgi:hypothetical protein